MKLHAITRTSIVLTATLAALLAVAAEATEPTKQPAKAPIVAAPVPHCQVPCGIYTDQLRFEQMLEDTKTIAKSIGSIGEITTALKDGELTPTNVNQLTRWINTKEDHASNIQKIVAEYFLTQRIKESNKDYTSQLIAAHKVMVAAMKCKQDANGDTPTSLEKAILDLYRAYEGKEPDFEHDKKK